MRAGVYVACRATCAVCRAMTAPSIRAVPKRVRLDQLLVERGAARGHAVDVGKGQLDWKLRSDPRVALHEGVNAREGIPVAERVDLVVADVSFISLRLVLPPALALLRDGGDVLALVKPQF